MSYERPERLEGSIKKIKMACGSLWIIIGIDTKGKPREVFLEGSKKGTCRANLEGEARLATALLQEGSWESVIEVLKGIRCPACMRTMGRLAEKGEELEAHPWSCPDAMAKEIEIILKEGKEKK